jgi:TnpA family transposase
VFHGKTGRIVATLPRREGGLVSALGLVLNVIALWNTIYMDAALTQLRAEGYSVRDEDVARLFATHS